MTQPLAIASSLAPTPADAVAELAAALAPIRPTLVLVFHSTHQPAQQVAAAVAQAFPGATTVGCSTMGEVAEGRFLRGGMTAIAFGPEARVALESIGDVRSWRYEQGAAAVGRLCAGLGCTPASLRADRHILLTLIDGLSGSDELILTSLSEVAPGVPLVGACAADDERFERTTVFVGTDVIAGGALLLLVEPGLPFLPFALHHYRPTGEKAVVTRADPAHRRVAELNGWPAIDEYARLCDVPVQRFRDHPELLLGQAIQFGVRGRDTLFLRGVMTLRGDDLVLAGAVEEGEILDVMVADDLVESTRRGLAEVLDRVDGDHQVLLLFSCGGRYHAAERQGVIDELADAMSPVPAVGFSTYGEHFGSLLVNYTLTGVAFSLPPPDPE